MKHTKQELYDGLKYMALEGRLPLDSNLRTALVNLGLVGDRLHAGKKGVGINTVWSITKTGHELIEEVNGAGFIGALVAHVEKHYVNLDGEVDTIKIGEANVINNSGVRAQVEYLAKKGGIDWLAEVVELSTEELVGLSECPKCGWAGCTVLNTPDCIARQQVIKDQTS